MSHVKVRNVPAGQTIEFSGATITDPKTGKRARKGGFTGVATDDILRFPDGKLRRLFVDIDPELSGGFDALWVEMEEDLAEALFALVATNPQDIHDEEVDSMRYEEMIEYDKINDVLNPLRGFAPDILPRLSRWLEKQLNLESSRALVSRVISEWVVRERGKGTSRVLLLEMAVPEPAYVLLRRTRGGNFRAIIIDHTDWIEQIRYWWNHQDLPPKRAGRFIGALVAQNEIWGEI